MEFWKDLYADHQKDNDMRMLKDYMDHNYLNNETEGPQYEEIMDIISTINEDKASSGNIKPQILKLGSKWCHDIIFRIIRQLWLERHQESARILNESKVILLYKDGNKS